MQVSKGVTLGVGILFLIIVASMLRAANLYYMAAVLVTLPALSFAIGWHSLRGLVFEREMPSILWAGEEAEIVYSIQNPSRFTRFFLSISEDFPESVESHEQEPTLFNVIGNESTRIAHRLTFTKRGVFQVRTFSVNAIDPLGIFTYSRVISCDSEIIVYPKPQNLQPISLTGADRNGLQEFTVSAPRGGSIEPDGVREYVPGDSLRRIHWKQTARTGRLAVLEFEEAQSIQVALFLDLQQGIKSGQEADSCFEYAIRYAASILEQALREGAGIRLLTPALDEAPLAGAAALPGRGESHFLSIMDTLARVNATSKQSVEESISETTNHLQSGATLIVVTSQTSSKMSALLTNLSLIGRFRVVLIFVDPDSFTNSKLSLFNQDRSEFFNGLLSAEVQTYILKRNAQSDVQPEVKKYVFN